MSAPLPSGVYTSDNGALQGAVALVTETGKSIAQVARELGVNEGTLGNWCAKQRRAGDGDPSEVSESERAELARLRKENRVSARTAARVWPWRA